MAAEHGPTTTLDTVTLLRAQVEEVHRRLDAGFTEWLEALAPAAPPPRSQPVGVFVHAAAVEDVALHTLLLDVAPLFATEWAGRGPARYSMDDLGPLRRYARDVWLATDAYLAALSPSAASRAVDLSRLNEGHPTVAWVVSRFVILELAQLTGELASAVQASKAAGH